MTGIKKHLTLFPPRLYASLAAFENWESIREIRLRRHLPLSLTGFEGNLFLSEQGKICRYENALICRDEEIRFLIGSFSKGSLYRYFSTMQDGFMVDEEGWRLGLCPEYNDSPLMPEIFQGASLRIPRNVPNAAKPILDFFHANALGSTLILSPPGDGKTTLLRSLATLLSRGEDLPPMRVAVVDERKELFPSGLVKEGGLCDVLSGYSKEKGIEIATRIFAPQVIVCDEIGSQKDAEAILRNGNAGTYFFASAHGNDLESARNRPGIRMLLEAGIFTYIAKIKRIPGKYYASGVLIKKIC